MMGPTIMEIRTTNPMQCPAEKPEEAEENGIELIVRLATPKFMPELK